MVSSVARIIVPKPVRHASRAFRALNELRKLSALRFSTRKTWLLNMRRSKK